MNYLIIKSIFMGFSIVNNKLFIDFKELLIILSFSGILFDNKNNFTTQK